jgi:hypothetical protein
MRKSARKASATIGRPGQEQGNGVTPGETGVSFRIEHFLLAGGRLVSLRGQELIIDMIS